MNKLSMLMVTTLFDRCCDALSIWRFSDGNFTMGAHIELTCEGNWVNPIAKDRIAEIMFTIAIGPIVEKYANDKDLACSDRF